MNVKVNDCWQSLMEWGRRRQVMLVFMLVGAILFLVSQGYLLTTQPVQQCDLDRVKASFCESRDPNPEVCTKLFDALLDYATPEQREKLTMIVEEER